MNIDHDLHIHSYLSSCCSAKQLQTPRNIVSLAEKMGMQTIGFADHLWMNPEIPASTWYKPQNENQIKRLKQDLLAVKTNVRVLVGCEADTIAPGKFSVTKGFAESLDFVLLSCSHIHLMDTVEQPKSYALRDVADHLVQLFLSGVRSGIPTAIAHPFTLCGHLNGLYESLLNTLSDTELFDAFSVARENNVAVEINAAAVVPGKMNPRFSVETPLRVITIAKKAGCKFTFGSDAHDPAGQQALRDMQLFINTAGITNDDILELSHGTSTIHRPDSCMPITLKNPVETVAKRRVGSVS